MCPRLDYLDRSFPFSRHQIVAFRFESSFVAATIRRILFIIDFWSESLRQSPNIERPYVISRSRTQRHKSWVLSCPNDINELLLTEYVLAHTFFFVSPFFRFDKLNYKHETYIIITKSSQKKPNDKFYIFVQSLRSNQNSIGVLARFNLQPVTAAAPLAWFASFVAVVVRLFSLSSFFSQFNSFSVVNGVIVQMRSFSFIIIFNESNYAHWMERDRPNIVKIQYYFVLVVLRRISFMCSFVVVFKLDFCVVHLMGILFDLIKYFQKKNGIKRYTRFGGNRMRRKRNDNCITDDSDDTTEMFTIVSMPFANCAQFDIFWHFSQEVHFPISHVDLQ